MKKTIVLLLCLLLMLAAGCADKNAGSGPFDTPRPTANTTAEPAPVSTKAETAASTSETNAPETTAVPVTEAPTEAATEPSTEAPTEPPVEKTDPWKLMAEALLDQGSYTDELGNNYSYSYCLPYLKADTADAKAINDEIDTVFGARVREAKEAMQNGQSLAFYSCGYYGEVWGDVLSLVVVGHWDWGIDDYGVYCYDTVAGTRLDTPALLERMGISQEQFLETSKLRFRAYFEDMYKDIPVDQRENYGYDMFLSKVDAPEYVNLELMAYPNANGDLVVIAPIVSMAGADYYYHPVILGIR